jgi:hypothetical protein
MIAEQKSIFHELPAAVRAKFENDPANYLNMVLTDEGVQELAEMLNPTPEPDEPDPEPEIEPKTAQKQGEEQESSVT